MKVTVEKIEPTTCEWCVKERVPSPLPVSHVVVVNAPKRKVQEYSACEQHAHQLARTISPAPAPKVTADAE